MPAHAKVPYASHREAEGPEPGQLAIQPLPKAPQSLIGNGTKDIVPAQHTSIPCQGQAGDRSSGMLQH